jgi:hypothetical protein
LTEPYKVTTVRLDRQGISNSSVAVQCAELSTVHHERGSQTTFPSPSASWNITTCLLCSLEASCTSCTNDRYSSEGISKSISEPLLLRYSEGIAVIALEQLNSELGIPISQRDENDPEWNKWYCHQYSMERQNYQVAINITAKGMRNRWSKTLGPINENVTQCLQRYAVLGYESNRNDLFLTISNNVFQIIPSGNNYNFLRMTEGIWRSSLRYSAQPGASSFCRINNFYFELWYVCLMSDKYWKYNVDTNTR